MFIFIFEREREREKARAEQGHREKGNKISRLQAPSYQHGGPRNAGLEFTNCKIISGGQSQTLNQLSNPGAPAFLLSKTLHVGVGMETTLCMCACVCGIQKWKDTH